MHPNDLEAPDKNDFMERPLKKEREREKKKETEYSGFLYLGTWKSSFP
jgi:hypothetical protein